MPTFYCNYFFCLTLGGPLDFAYPAYLIVMPLNTPNNK